MIAPALLLAAAAFAAPAPPAAPPAPRAVTFKTADGWTLAADYRPARKGGVVLILAHGVASSKNEWAYFCERLQAEGVGTLALDLRGHDKSQAGPRGHQTYESFDATGEWPKAVRDFVAAEKWLAKHGVPASRIALGGASIGANLAANEAMDRPKTPFLVLLSPGPDYRGVKLVARKGLKTLVGASPGDGFAYQTLEPFSKMPDVTTFTAPAGHGAQMFEDKATLDVIVSWIAAASKTAGK